MQFEIIPIRTKQFLPPRDELNSVLANIEIQERDIVCISSKVVAIGQGRCVKIPNDEREAKALKQSLIERESDILVERHQNKHGFCITYNHNTLIASAGIDESNGNGYFILWPENIQAQAQKIWKFLKEKNNLSELGVLILDSHCVPGRTGTVGTVIGFWGMDPVQDYRGEPDVFGRPLVVSRKNRLEPIGAIANMTLGEGAEQTPLCLVRGIEDIIFTDQDKANDFFIAPEEDIFSSLFYPSSP